MKGRTAILVLLGTLIVLGTVIGIIVVQLFYRQPFIPPSTMAAMLSLTPQGTITPGTKTPVRIVTATSGTPNPPTAPISSPELLNTPGPTVTPGPLKEVCGTTEYAWAGSNPRPFEGSLRYYRFLYSIDSSDGYHIAGYFIRWSNRIPYYSGQFQR